MSIEGTQVVLDTVALVRIDSQNPGAREGECARWVHERLQHAGITVATQAVQPGRDNLIARVPGHGRGPRLVLLAHLDTVPIGAGWTVPPLEGLIRDGRIYGRGAADMKAGLAVAINLLASLAGPPVPSSEIVLCATVDEEGPDMAGAHALVAGGLVIADDQVLALAVDQQGARRHVHGNGLERVALRPSILLGRTSYRVPCCNLAASPVRSRMPVLDVHGDGLERAPRRWQVTITYMPFRSAARGRICVRTPI